MVVGGALEQAEGFDHAGAVVALGEGPEVQAEVRLRALLDEQRLEGDQRPLRGVAVAAPHPRQTGLLVAGGVDVDDAPERRYEALEDGAVGVGDADAQGAASDSDGALAVEEASEVSELSGFRTSWFRCRRPLRGGT